MGGVGVAGAVLLLAVRVGEDDSKVWFVLGGLMLIATLAALAIVFLVYRHAMEARAAALALSAERSLISMRAARTIDGVGGAKPVNNDVASVLSAMLGGVPSGDVVDQPAPVSWEEGGGGFGE